MTEKRPVYHAHSSERIMVPLAPFPTSAIPATPPDTLILLPIVESGHEQQAESPCLQLIHQESGNLGFCNIKTTQRCLCCGSPTCAFHYWKRPLALPGVVSPDESLVVLCETCAHLPRRVLVALYQLRQALNEEANV